MFRLQFYLMTSKRSMLNQHAYGHFWWKQNWILYKYLWELYTHHIKYIISISYEQEGERKREREIGRWKAGYIHLRKRTSNKHLTYSHTKWKFVHILWFALCCVVCCVEPYAFQTNSGRSIWNNRAIEFRTQMHIAVLLKRKWMANHECSECWHKCKHSFVKYPCFLLSYTLHL